MGEDLEKQQRVLRTISADVAPFEGLELLRRREVVPRPPPEFSQPALDAPKLRSSLLFQVAVHFGPLRARVFQLPEHQA